MKYFFEVFEALPRQGPGCAEATLRALGIIRPQLPRQPAVLDIGCGSGVQTRLLARALDTRIVAIDNHAPFLQRLREAAAAEGLPIEAREASMLALPFAEASFDLLWAEGSIFIMGLAPGLAEFRRFLRPGGFLAFTELCWFDEAPPREIRDYFDKVSPDMRNADQMAALAAQSGYRVVDGFNLPDSAWWDDYYRPMQARLAEFKARHAGDAEALEVYDLLDTEIGMFRRHSRHYGYRFVILQREE